MANYVTLAGLSEFLEKCKELFISRNKNGGVAEHPKTEASGEYSHAEGDYSVASGGYSHAEGSGTRAEGYCSHAEGNNTHATGNYSHAEGGSTYAIGNHSHAEGCYTTTNNDAEHAEGSYNVSHNSGLSFGDEGNTIHSVGIGEDDGNRCNAHEIMQNGDHYIYGVGGFDGTNYNTADTLQDVIRTLGKYSCSSTSSSSANVVLNRYTEATTYQVYTMSSSTTTWKIYNTVPSGKTVAYGYPRYMRITNSTSATHTVSINFNVVCGAKTFSLAAGKSVEVCILEPASGITPTAKWSQADL